MRALKRLAFIVAGLILATLALAQPDTPAAAMASAATESWMERPWQFELSKRQAEQLGLTITSSPKHGRVTTAPHWIFHADGTLEAKGLWRGTWSHAPHSRLVASVTPAGQTAPLEMEIQFAPGGKTGLYIRFSEGLVGTGRLIETVVAGDLPAATVPGVAGMPTAAPANDVHAATPGGEPPAPSMDELFEQLAAQFDSLGKDKKLMDRDFVKSFNAAKPLPDTACSQQIFTHLARMERYMSPFGNAFDDKRLTSPEYLRALNENTRQYGLMPEDIRRAFSDNKRLEQVDRYSLSLVPSTACDRVLVRYARVAWMSNGKHVVDVSYSDIRMDFGFTHTVGKALHNYKGYEWIGPGVDSVQQGTPGIDGNRDKVAVVVGDQFFYEDPLEEVFRRFPDNIRSVDPWSPATKAEIAGMEKARKAQLAEAQAARRAREVREAEESRLAAIEADSRRKQEQARLDAALNAKTAQAMYLAAGKYEREGDDYNARQVYERLIDRFPDSPFAAKANDQLLERKREERASADLRDARSEQGRRAFEACRMEMDACYSRNGRDCWRDCEKLR